MIELPPGTRLRLEYADHNDEFEAQLPRDVTVVRRASARNDVDDWYLVSLAESVRWDGTAYTRLLIRSREHGTALGGTRPTGVFILLVPPGDGVPADGFDPHEFIHVAWGQAARIPTSID